MDDEWLSECYGYPPDDRFQFDTFMTSEPIGVCSKCKDHVSFSKGEYNGND